MRPRHRYEATDPAGWRRGYAADCKAPLVSQEINSIVENCCQDEPRTQGEPDNRPSKPKSILSRLIKDRHKRASKALGYALTLADPKNWALTALVWEARLEPAERYELARSVMLAMRPEDIEALAADVMGGAGLPLPPFLDPLDDAQWWADLANPAERRAYCLAAFMAMSQREQRDFLDFASGAAA